MALGNKFQRFYQLVVELRNDIILNKSIPNVGGTFQTIELPFTVEFDIERKNFGSANTANFRIYNLNANTRNLIRYDQFDMGIFRSITFYAGYQGIQPAIAFNGNFSRAYSVREGVDFVTHIEAYDGSFGFATSTSNIQFPAGTPFNAVLANLMLNFQSAGINPGLIGPTFISKGPLLRGNTFSGSTYSLIKELTGNGFFVDNMKAHCLCDNEAFPGSVAQIDSSFGLLNTPYLEQTYVMFDILFEPRLQIGQTILLNSLTTSPNISSFSNLASLTASNSTYNLYKIVGLRHRGTISGAVCGDAVTTVSCLYSKELTVI